MKKFLIIFVLFIQTLIAESIYTTFDVEANRESQLSLQIAGIVQKLYVDIASEVKKGDLLLELENSQERADVEVAKSQLDLAEVGYEHALTNFNRYKKIKKVIDEEQFERVKFEKNLKLKELEKAKKALKLKEIILAKTKLYAPYNGIIVDKMVEVGDGVAGVNSKLLSILDDSKVKLILKFDEKHWKKVKIGQKVIYRVDGEDEKREGKISKIYPTAYKSDRKLKAEVLTKDILIGLFGDGTIEVER